MLITFHSCVVLIFQILKNRKRLKLVASLPSNTDLDETDLENYLRFDPPVYRQRYARVYETLLNEKWRNNIQKLVDFGCAELSLFIYIKNLNVEQVLFVDIDETLLQGKIGKIEPLLVDNLRRRNSPLEVSVFSGSVADPDYRLHKTDVVTAIELIEHLYPDTLDAFPYNIFSFIKPKIVIITTPNADFNVLFNRDGFRHPDHKYEWTREQFESWAKNIVKRFPNYTVQFSGVGQGPENTECLGCCSQMALFLRKDLLYDDYISAQYAKACFCDKGSPCKGQTTESKLLCNCVCPLCLPDFSVGICTYLTCSKDIDFKDINRESYSRKKYSDTNLESNPCPTYYTFEDKATKVSNYINPSYNIYYNLIQKIDYPFEIDPRSEKERLLHTFRYRIQTFSHFNSRFYVSEKERCEIPITDIMYGDIDVSVEEISHLLINAGYEIVKCTIQETGSCEDCIISVPQEMEDITSSSEVTDGYSSKSSEPSDGRNFEANKDSLSDWDEVTYLPRPVQQGTTSSSVEPSSEPKKPNPDPLFDSGYLKSPSPLENTSKLPQSPQENPELTETDQFEDVVSTASLTSNDNKLHLKKTVAKEKFASTLMLESQKQKYDPNRVNELDRFHNMSTTKTFMNNYLKPQSEFKKGPFKDLSVAGTSSGWKKNRKFKVSACELPTPTATEKQINKGLKIPVVPLKLDKKVAEKKDIVEPSPLDDAKSITNCIIQNSLNRIDVGDEIVNRKAELIRNFNPPPPPPPELNVDIVVIPEQPEVVYIDALDVVPEVPPQGVENGDLANNNRDNEGNNFAANIIQEQDIDEGIDLLNDNLEELVPLLEDNINAFDNNNDDLAVEGHNIEVPAPVEHRIIEEVVENFDGNGGEHEGSLEADDSVAHASREALFDANSEQDLLEDFDIPPQGIHDDIIDLLNLGSSVLLVGLHGVSSSGTRRDLPPGAASIQTNTNSFPNWLLQILGNHVTSEEPAAPLGTHDEPHFYCQGDGLGVHPSVIAIDVDEAEDADNDTSAEDSSSNNTADFAEVEPGPSDMFDMSSLPEESSVATSLMEDTAGHTLRGGGSVVWTERESNDNDDAPPPIELTDSEEDAILDEAIAQGHSLVDDVILSAEQEVVIRCRQASEDFVKRASKSSEDAESSSQNVSTPDSCCIVSMTDNYEVVKPDELRKEPKPLTTNQDLMQSSDSADTPDSADPADSDVQSEPLPQFEESIQDVQSSSGSEQSEYYETQ